MKSVSFTKLRLVSLEKAFYLLSRSKVVSNMLGMIRSLLLGLALTSCASLPPSPRVSLTPYDATRDQQELANYFAKDRYWLVSDPFFSIQDYETRPSQGQRVSKVLRVDAAFAGYLSYSFTAGTQQACLDLILVAPAFRKSDLSARLVEATFADLRTRGFKVVNLITRSNNSRAYDFFIQHGFVVTRRDWQTTLMHKKL